MSAQERRAIRATVLTVTATVAVALGAPAAGWGRLPEPVASHWSWDGTPDGTLPRAGLLALAAVAAVVAAVLTRVAAVAHDEAAGSPRPSPRSPAGVLAAFVGGLGATVSVLTVGANVDAPTWDRARPVGPVAALVAVALPLTLAALSSRWWRRAATARAATASGTGTGPPATAGLRPGERALWIGWARSRWGLPLALAGAVGGAVAAAGYVAVAGLPGLVLVAVGVTFTSLRLTVGAHGVAIALGPLRWPVLRIPLDAVARAEPVTVRPMAVGGWGYRGGLRLFGRAALVLRAGEGVRLTCRDGRVLVVTVDDATPMAGVVNDLIASSAATGTGA
jgi:hypothetical protein